MPCDSAKITYQPQFARLTLVSTFLKVSQTLKIFSSVIEGYVGNDRTLAESRRAFGCSQQL